LESDGLTSESFRLRSLGMNLPGAFRRLVALPTNLTWKYVSNAHACTMITSANHSTGQARSSPVDGDVKRLRLATNDCPEDEGEFSEQFASNAVELPKKILGDSNNCCNDIEISFSLEPSCYATSCIRELMKR